MDELLIETGESKEGGEMKLTSAHCEWEEGQVHPGRLGAGVLWANRGITTDGDDSERREKSRVKYIVWCFYSYDSS